MFEMEVENNIKDVMNVCRLCLGTDSLMSIFDDRIQIPENMKDVIQITTGVTISPSDNISKKLCFKCVNITIRMFKFRSSSIVNDLELKEKACMLKRNSELHESVQSLLLKNPGIILPPSITTTNISPKVSINKNSVQNWRIKHKRKKKLEETRKLKLTLIKETEVLKRDLEGEIVPHAIPNKDTLLVNPEKNLEAESTSVETSTSLHEVASSIPVNEPLSAMTNVTNELFSTDAIENSGAAPEENNAKRKLTLSLKIPRKKKAKLDNGSDDSNSLLDLKYVNECIFLCDICNTILYNVKDLKKHKNKHMRCSLCKKSFRSLRETEEHSEKFCRIKHIMNNLPTVYVKRCDESYEIRQQYAAAFASIPNGNWKDLSEKKLEIHSDTSRERENEVRFPQEKESGKSETCRTEIADEVSLISDDEHSPSEKNQRVTDGATEKVKASLRSVRQKDKPKTVPSFKPKVGIIGENILDLNLDNDENTLLRNLLKLTAGKTKVSSVQTNLPNNLDIITSLNRDKLFEMRNLREFLNYYKIPVNVSHATHYSAKFGHDSSLLSKIDHSWSVIKTRKNPAVIPDNNKLSIPQNQPIEAPNNTSASGTVPPLILIRTTSTANPTQTYPPASSQNVQSGSSNSSALIESFGKTTTTTKQNVHYIIQPAISHMNGLNDVRIQTVASVQNEIGVQKTPNLQNNANPPDSSQNVQSSCSNSSALTGSFDKSTTTTKQNVRYILQPAISNMNGLNNARIQTVASVQNEVDVQKTPNVQNNSYPPASGQNVQISRSNSSALTGSFDKTTTTTKQNVHYIIQPAISNMNGLNNARIQTVASVQNEVYVQRTPNLQINSNASSNHVPDITSLINISTIQSPINQKIVDNVDKTAVTVISTISQNNVSTATSTNSNSMEGSRNAISTRPDQRPNGIVYSTYNNNILNGTTINLTKSSPQVSHNRLCDANINLATGKNNSIIPIQKYVIGNGKTSVTPQNFTNVQRNASSVVNTTSINSNNYINRPAATVTCKPSHDSHNKIYEATTSGNLSMANPDVQRNHLNTPHNNKSLQISNSQKTSQDVNYSRGSENLNMWTSNGGTTRNESQSTYTTASTQLQVPNFVPLIRVRNVSELR